MARFIVRNHRARRKLTLTAAHSDSITASISLTLDGRRVITLSDRVCEKYADSIAAFVESGDLLEAPPAASE